MNARITVLAGVLALTAWGCKADSRYVTVFDTDEDVVGTYFAADSGHNLGKDWCYKGALVLDSTKHFGSVITMCGDEGSGPVTENLKGTYRVRRVRTRVDGGARRVRRLEVILEQEGKGRSHTLRYERGTLRFDEPWWLGAGLGALGVADPVLRKIPEEQLGEIRESSTPDKHSPARKGGN